MLEKILQQFIQDYLPERPPLLLGLSGGGDSMALFHLLVCAHYPFEAAYVDHGWREESVQEGVELQSLCAQAGVVFHTKRLESNSLDKNLEDEGRQERLTFFKEIVQRRKLQGVMLAHHADDHAETVLKRILEGASLPKLRGLKSKHSINGLDIYRPLLKARKKILIDWLEEKKESYFTDPTNSDPRFLRTRLRESIIPKLCDHFGKEVSSNLCRLGDMAAELDEFLAALASPYLNKMERSPTELSLDFSSIEPQPLLMKTVVRAFFLVEKITPSYQLIEQIVLHLNKGSCHKVLKVGAHTLLIHKKRVRLIK